MAASDRFPVAGPVSGVAWRGGNSTHEVTNQVPPLLDYDASDDLPLREGLEREGAGWYRADLERLGRLAGSQEMQEHADKANKNKPVLKTHDRIGNRIDEVDYHPSWHKLLGTAINEGLGGGVWTETRSGAHVARCAGDYTFQHTEAGHACPLAMSYAVIPTLRFNEKLTKDYEPLLTNRVYDPGLRIPSQKRGLLAVMGMTEKQGGSDVRTNTTTATPTQESGVYALRGHKWFTSAPMGDLVFLLAQAPEGLSCFMAPRILPDGTRNPFHIQRLKDKVGNWSNASSEPEFDGMLGWLIGEEGKGVKTIIEMVNYTRLYCILGSSSIMRQSVVHALHNAKHRSAFGGRLIDKPLMRNVLSDMALESEAATALMLRIAGSIDRSLEGDATEKSFRRVATAIGKYWITKRTPGLVVEAMECLGGNGYVEESPIARLYREAPLNSIWEGAGNVNALDVFRALAKDAGSRDAIIAELAAARGADRRYDTAADAVIAQLTTGEEASARRIVERTALALQASLLLQFSTPAVADAFVGSRLAGDWGQAYGTLSPSVDMESILTRAAGHTA